ncbi:hypothetical protein [Undibacterium squillarum]|uniref:Uncharacterized protein n=1 Tax=Undibacterium squillarum TaxID=1131567 RepID=A0ABQ2XUK3_9BURK|nr:hypothetical protein [Undibacterium squillarum]GGX34480.1 hypothetical protein GCM10010946_09610 [Undibacterium squillarum]
MKFQHTAFMLLITIVLFSTNAYGYVGPGMGVGAIASVLGIIVGFFILLIGAVWYPFKKLIKKLRGKK